MPRMGDINQKKSKYFKVADLEQATGQRWATAQLAVEIEAAEVGTYPGQDGEEDEDAFFLYFKGHAKPLGCNLTNRKVMEGVFGEDAEWDTATLGGAKLIVYAEHTSMGAGIRIRPDLSHVPPTQPVTDEGPEGNGQEIPF